MKLKIYIHASHSAALRKHYFSADCIDLSSAGFLKLEEREIDFEPPPEAVLVAGTIDAYRAEQTKIRAEAQAKVSAIDERIQSLLAIEHKSDEAAKGSELPF